MLIAASSVFALTLLVLVIRSGIWTTAFLRTMSEPSEVVDSAGSTSSDRRAVVILPVRGKDPFLVRCIESLAHQTGVNYLVRVVIDHETDPATSVIREALERVDSSRVQMEFLTKVRTTCGAKNSALLQVVESLEPEDYAIVVVDSDVVADSTWLSQLLRPFSDHRIGVTTSMRWFTPRTQEPGTLVRYLWNAASVPEMVAFQVPFGGSMAIRREVLEQGGLAELWAHSLFDDCIVPQALKRIDLRYHVVPGATTANEESISLGRCFVFLRRQMLNALCYNPSSHWILASCVAMAVAFAGAIVTAVVAILSRNDPALLISAGGLGVFGLGMGGCLWGLEVCLRRILRDLGHDVPPWRANALLCGGLTVFVYVAATLSACRLQRVSWRGLHYTRQGRTEFRLERHEPFAPETRTQAEHASVH